MIGCKMIRALASVEFEIILILGLPYCLSSSSVQCLENDPYKAIRQAYLVGMDTESEPIEDPVETEAPESHHTVASPTLLPDSTPPTCHDEELEGSNTSSARSTSSDSTTPLSPNHPLTHTTPTLVPVLRRTTRMAVLLREFTSTSPPDLASRKRYWDTSELVEDDEEEDDEEDEEIEKSSDSDSMSEGAEDEGPTAEDKDPAMGDEGLATGDEGPCMGVESLSLGGDEAVLGGQQRAALVVETTVGEPLGLGYGAMRHREIALGEGRMPSVFEPTLTTWMDPEDGIVYINVPAYPPPAPPAQTPPSLEWSSSSLPISPAPSIVPSPISSPMISLTVPSLHTISDTHGENRELRLQLAEERRARLKLAEVVDSLRRGQDPRGDV
ncbi:hypothetical protein Tco_1556865 [Tanacetum coccineum]